MAISQQHSTDDLTSDDWSVIFVLVAEWAAKIPDLELAALQIKVRGALQRRLIEENAES